MTKRTTIELDMDLLERAKRALGTATTRETVHTALLRAAQDAEGSFEERRRRQIAFLESLDRHVDIGVLRSGEMWR